MAGYRKLGRTSSQRKALIRGQVTSLLNNGKIVTTEKRIIADTRDRIGNRNGGQVVTILKRLPIDHYYRVGDDHFLQSTLTVERTYGNSCNGMPINLRWYYKFFRQQSEIPADYRGIIIDGISIDHPEMKTVISITVVSQNNQSRYARDQDNRYCKNNFLFPTLFLRFILFG